MLDQSVGKLTFSPGSFTLPVATGELGVGLSSAPVSGFWMLIFYALGLI